MTIHVLSNSPSQRVTSFADTFVGADRPFYMGSAWWSVISARSALGTRLAADINIGGTGLVFGDGTGNNDNNLQATFSPVNVDNTAIQAQSPNRGAFVEWEFVSRPIVGNGCTVAIGVMTVPDQNIGYYWIFGSNDGGTAPGVGKYTGNFAAGVSFNGGVLLGNVAYTIGDVLRLEAIPETGLVRINTKKNGVVVSTGTDTGADRLTSGLYSITLLGVFTGKMIFKNFNAGLI